MKVKFLGAAKEVTGSSYLLTSGSGKTIIIDFGMFQGIPELERLNYEPLSFDPSLLSGAILTHAHLDHSGRLPLLLKYGYKGNIWMTPPTRDLTEISLYDTAKIEKENKEQVLYNHDLAVQTVLKFETVEYDTPKQIGDFNVVFRDAGHILGASSLEITDLNPDSDFKKIVFSGDLGNTPEPLERPTEMVDSADVVVMESTYGDRIHPKSDPANDVQSEINKIERDGGILLIPTFSLDRTQEILHMIMHLKKSGKVKNETQIYVDSPMAEKATRVYVEYPKYFNQEVQSDLKVGDIFSFPGLTTVQKGADSEALHQNASPKVIIAGSGMMTGGRIVAHAAYYLPIASTRLLIVGYQAEGTLGRRILNGEKTLNINGATVNVAATITETQAMSSHADQSQLISWLKHIQNVKKVFLTHGEIQSQSALTEKIKSEIGIADVVCPDMNQEISV